MNDDSTSSSFAPRGRRRLDPVTKDEWQEALKRQNQEKDEQRQIAGATTRSRRGNQSESTVLPEQPLDEDPLSVVQRTGGRRMVRALINDEWKASLELQIREKELQKRSQNQTAPSHADISEHIMLADELKLHIMKLQLSDKVIEPTSAPGFDSTPIRGRRRGIQPQQSREEFLKGLQEQIEMKKRLQSQQIQRTEDLSANQQTLLDENATVFAVPGDSRVSGEEAPEDETIPGLDPAASDGSNVSEALAVDPHVLAELLKACHDMKQQHEELKQQLLEQKIVLVSLSKDKTVAPPNVSNLPSQHQPLYMKSTPSVQSSTQEKRKSMKLRLKKSAIANTWKGKCVSIPTKSIVAATQSLGENLGPVIDRNSLQSNKSSRLPQPRIMPRIATAKAMASLVKEETSEPKQFTMKAAKKLVTVKNSEVSTHEQAAYIRDETAVDTLPPLEYVTPTMSSQTTKTKPGNGPLRNQNISLPALDPTRSFFSITDKEAGNTSFSCHKKGDRTRICRNDHDLDTRSSSEAILDGPSAFLSLQQEG